MKYIITVEVTHNDHPLKPKDLKGQIVSKFPKVAPKLFQKSIRTICWPFDANIKIEFVEEEVKDKVKKKEKRKKKQKHEPS